MQFALIVISIFLKKRVKDHGDSSSRLLEVLSLQVKASHCSKYCLQVSFSREQQYLTMHLKYAKILAIVVHENKELGDNTLNNERLSLVNAKFLTKY